MWPMAEDGAGTGSDDASAPPAVEVLLADVTDEPLAAGEVAALVADSRCGAVVTFAGVVRDHDGGRGVRALEYQAHPDAGRLLARCCASITAPGRAGQVAGPLRIAARHRVGALAIGDVALVVAIASPHRAEAFAAACVLVDRIKAEVPVWKRQHYADGDSGWVGL